MQKPEVFPRFIQLCFELLHISGFNYFSRQRVPVGENEVHQVQSVCLFHDFHSMATGFSLLIAKKSLGSTSSMPFMILDV